MTTKDRAGDLPGARSVRPVGEEPGVREWAAELVDRARAEILGDDDKDTG